MSGIKSPNCFTVLLLHPESDPGIATFFHAASVICDSLSPKSTGLAFWEDLLQLLLLDRSLQSLKARSNQLVSAPLHLVFSPEMAKEF